MIDTVAYKSSILFAIVAGTGAGVLAGIAWSTINRSINKRPLQLVGIGIWLATFYHGALTVIPSRVTTLQLLLILSYVAFGAAIIEVVRGLTNAESNQKMVEQTLLRRSAFGAIVFSFGGPFLALVYPSLIHWVHGFAGVAVMTGFYAPVAIQDHSLATGRSRSVADREWPDWMTALDEAILEVLYSTEMVLTPVVIAVNIEKSRAEVNRRLSTLEEKQWVERIERGKYRLTSRGEAYMQGGE